MKIIRKTEINLNNEKRLKVGDVIQIGKHYTATCQKVIKNSALFMFDQYLDETYPMNKQMTNEGGYKASYLRKFLTDFSTDGIFYEIRDRMKPFKETGDLLRIPTAEEMFEPDKKCEYYETISNKKQFPLMKDRRNLIAYRGEEQENEIGWLQNKYIYYGSSFALISANGLASHDYASKKYGVRVVFQLTI